MTIKTSGQLSMDDINAEFAIGNDLYAYRGVKWYRDDNSRGFFDASGNNPPIDFFEFYGTRKSIPVVPTGDVAQANGTYFTFPFYNKITVTLVGGNAGQNGAPGSYSGGPASGSATAGGTGTAGGDTSFGSFGTAAGGAAGGGIGETKILVFNADTDPNAPKKGVTVLITVGAGGTGGGGGPIFGWVVSSGNFGTYVLAGYAPSGANGSAGSVIIRVE